MLGWTPQEAAMRRAASVKELRQLVAAEIAPLKRRLALPEQELALAAHRAAEQAFSKKRKRKHGRKSFNNFR